MADLHITNEYDQLKTVFVCFGENIPLYEEYKTDDPEFTKFHPYSWNKDLLLDQQKKFFDLLTKYDVELIFPKTGANLLWQMYTRDTAFVVGQKLYYCSTRKMEARNGELQYVVDALGVRPDQTVSIAAEIEGGDVLVHSTGKVYVGHSSRTSAEAVDLLAQHVDLRKFELGENVMHLDTRLTLLSDRVVLLTPSSFSDEDLSYLRSKYKVIEVFDPETKKLGTNVFVINPETVVVPTQHKRIGELIKDSGFKVEYLDYTEPRNLGGSFRCTTMPIQRLG